MIKTEKPRYIKFEIISEKPVKFRDLRTTVLKTALEFLGEDQYRNAKILILEEHLKNKKGVIKTTHRYVDKVKVVLALIKKIKDINVIIRSLKVSGTLRGF